MSDNDCPDCHRLNAINARLRKLPHIVPAGAAEGLAQLKADAEWMSSQLRGFQQWAARVVTLQDYIDSLTAAADAGVSLKVVAERAQRVRQEYESLFKQPDQPKGAA